MNDELVNELLEAWEIYGNHSDDCVLWPEGGATEDCTCGYEEACAIIDKLAERNRAGNKP